jgi:DNA-binding MarR family transcriptional regulator
MARGRNRSVRFDQLFTYKLSLLVKLTDRETAAVYRKHARLGLSEARAITIIGREQPLRVQHLADFGSLDKSQASRVAVSLARRGLIRKVDDATDRRTSAISLTPAGVRMYEKLVALAVSRNEAILRPLGPRQRAELVRLLDTVLAPVAGAAADA